MKVALVHDYLVEYGGAERVLEALHEIWPEAPVYVAISRVRPPTRRRSDPPNSAGLTLGRVRPLRGSDPLGFLRGGADGHGWKWWERFRNWDIRSSWFDKMPVLRNYPSPLRFLAPLIWESFDFSGYDVVISSASWFITKSIVTGPETLHICYCHTPPRYLWGLPTAENWKKHWWTRIPGYIVNHFLRQYDYLGAQRVDYFVANSKNTGARIAKFYRREAKVIYPPCVEADSRGWLRGEMRNDEEDYYLCVSRLSAEKHIDLAVEACLRLGERLVVVGDGKEISNLKSQISKLKNKKGLVEFRGKVSDRELGKLYAGCKAVIFPAEEEDFGIVPAEAMSFGKAVIAYKSGGVLETVIEGKTGVFFEELTAESLMEAIKQFTVLSQRRGRHSSRFTEKEIKEWAGKFNKERFKKEMREFVNESLALGAVPDGFIRADWCRRRGLGNQRRSLQ